MTATGNGPIPCMGTFQRADFSATFACSRTQADGKFSDFKVNKDSREGGMEEIENVVAGLLDDGTVENGEEFLFVDMDFRYKGRSPTSWMVWGEEGGGRSGGRE